MLGSGDQISVFWPLQNQYFSRTVASICNNGQHVTQYDEDDVETLNER